MNKLDDILYNKVTAETSPAGITEAVVFMDNGRRRMGGSSYRVLAKTLHFKTEGWMNGRWHDKWTCVETGEEVNNNSRLQMILTRVGIMAERHEHGRRMDDFMENCK